MTKKAKTNNNIIPTVLLILDGWGIAPPNEGNAVTLAKTPVMDKLRERYSYTRLNASGAAVGLPKNQDGNSEAGHMNLGAGRKVLQDSVYVSKSIKDGTFFKNTAFKEAIKHAQKYKTSVHVMGLLSNGDSAHSCPGHLYALLKVIRDYNIDNVFIHFFTDGRDSPRFAALRLLEKLRENFVGKEQIASVMGRFYAMDRIKMWNRTELAYNAIVCGEGIAVESAEKALSRAYNRGESDEFILPSLVVDKDKKPIGQVKDNDIVMFFNLRSDRARQLTKAFVQKDFENQNHGVFKRKYFPKNIRFVAMTDFGPDLPHIFTAFPSCDIINSFPCAISNLNQIYIAETEKFSHITYFFNGGWGDPICAESRLRIPSPRIAHYDQQPQMSAKKIVRATVKKLKKKKHHFIGVNFANPDMIGHTGNLKAGIKAVEIVDECVGMIIKEVLKLKGNCIITADHGNIEEMINLKTGEVDTKHSSNPVPFFLVNHRRKKRLPEASLCNVAPTILDLMEIQKPKEMTGRSML